MLDDALGDMPGIVPTGTGPDGRPCFFDWQTCECGRSGSCVLCIDGVYRHRSAAWGCYGRWRDTRRVS